MRVWNGERRDLERAVWSWCHVCNFKARGLGEVEPDTYFTLILCPSCVKDRREIAVRTSRTGAFERWVES